MLWSASQIVGYDIAATDGSIGRVADFLFDDAAWAVRWMEVDTGGWLSGRKILIPPSCLGRPHPSDESFPVELTRKQVEESPELASDQPVSHQHETRIYDYYGWEPYWTIGPWPGGYAAPFGMMPRQFPAGARPRTPVVEPEQRGDPHLRSTESVVGHHIEATDGEIGHVDDFLLDSECWAIRYLVVDTRNWWPGKKVLVAPQWMQAIDWPDRRITCDLTREQIRSSPEFDPQKPLGRDAEERLHRHYQRLGYWMQTAEAGEDNRANRS